MWFKNLLFYRFSKPFELSADQLESQLEEFTFRRCGSQDPSTYGWVSPLGKHADALVHSAAGQLLVCAQKEEKMLPASVVKEMVEEKAELIEQEQARPVRRKEKETIRDEVVQTLLPRAFSRFQKTFAYISPEQGLLVVDSSSANRAEELMAHLRKSIGSLPVLPLTSQASPTAVMTQWLVEGPLPPQFGLLDEAELKSPLEGGGLVRVKQEDLLSDEIKAHLSNDKQVVKLALEYNDSFTFVLAEDMSVKRLKFTDVMKEQNQDVDSDDHLARMDADFALMAGEINAFVPDLLEALGGEQPLE